MLNKPANLFPSLSSSSIRTFLKSVLFFSVGIAAANLIDPVELNLN